MDDELQVLDNSVNRLHDKVVSFGADTLIQQAYPTEWSIADVLSHIGSGAEIMRRRLEDGIAGRATPDDFAPSVWDRWNAKTPGDKAADALVSDRALVDAFVAMTPEERDAYQMSLGPMTFDASGVIRLRINEHAFHTWDIEVALDPSATVPGEAVAIIVDNLDLIARFTAKPTGEVRIITVRTSEPAREFTIDMAADAVAFATGSLNGEPTLQLSAEAFARLIYGRLDPAHTPKFKGPDADLDSLRKVFKGP